MPASSLPPRALFFAAPLALSLIFTAASRAQILHSQDPLPVFEAATIKPFKDPPSNWHQPGGDEVYLAAMSARGLIEFAYRLPPGSTARVLNAPKWVDSDLYEVDGKIDPALAATMQRMPLQQQIEKRRLLLQSLLQERFQLKIHFETQVLPVYALTTAEKGAKLSPAKDLPPLDPSQPAQPRNPANLRNSLMIAPKGGQQFEMIARGETMDQFATMLTPHPEIGGRPVVNRTGLTSAYDFTMDWTREQGAAAAGDDSGPGLFTALQQQLGLKLVPSRAPVEVLVIDSISHPTPN